MLVLFDIDGTLLSSASAGRAAIAAAFADEYSDESLVDRVRFDGKTDPQIVRELHQVAGRIEVPDDEVELLLERYLIHLERELETRRHLVRLHPGVTELLEVLCNDDRVVVGLLTGNIESGARLKLGAAGIDPGRFRLGAFGSDSAHRPDLPAVAIARAEQHIGRRFSGVEVVIIGDTPADVTCGAGVGARSIGVATGSYCRDDLVTAGADATFDDLGDTEMVLGVIHGIEAIR